MKSVENILKHLVPDAVFYGSLVANNEEAYNAIDWADNRPKPTWQELADAEAAYNTSVAREAIPSQIKGIADSIVYNDYSGQDIMGLLATAVDIADKKASGTATEEELSQADAIRSLWAIIKRVRINEKALTAQYVERGTELTAEDIETIQAALVAGGE